MKNKILACFFIGFLSFGFLFNLDNMKTALKSSLPQIENLEISAAVDTFEDQFNSGLCNRLEMINVNSLVRRLIGEKTVNGTIRDKNGVLFAEANLEYRFDANKESINIEKTRKILGYAGESGVKTLYIQAPIKEEYAEELPYGRTEEYKAKGNFWYESLGDYNALDLRECLEGDIQFYKTDHHWTVETSQKVAKALVEEINNLYNMELEEGLLDKKNYIFSNYKNSFLGSNGVRVGEYFGGKDDFEIAIPKFVTDVEYKHYVDGELEKRKTGNFEDAFIDKTLLEDPNYYNKYNSCLYGGYCENIIDNKKSGNSLKLMVISDSFARPMVQYLSLCFKETRYLDPQRGRYNESFIEYIKKYEPDVLLVMYSGEYVKI